MQIFKFLSYTSEAVACEKSVIYESHDLCFIRINFGFTVGSLSISEEVLVVERNIAFLGTLCLAPADIGADVLRFALCDTPVDGDVEFCAGLV